MTVRALEFVIAAGAEVANPFDINLIVSPSNLSILSPLIVMVKEAVAAAEHTQVKLLLTKKGRAFNAAFIAVVFALKAKESVH